MKHILLQKALKYKKRKIDTEPNGYLFDIILGAWINKENNTFLVETKGFMGLVTKKNDIETGEDQKGQ